MENFVQKPEDPDNKINYGILIKTSDSYANAGTRSVVHIDLINASGESTGPIKLGNFWHCDFQKGNVNQFRPYVKDIGMPLIVRITLENRHHEDEWLCDWIKVVAGVDEREFPIYAWIGEELEVTIGKAMLPQKVTNLYVQDLRKKEIEQNKVTFSWVPRPPEDSVGWGLPRYVDAASYAELPNMFKRDVVRARDFLDDGLGAGFQAIFDLISGVVEPLTDVDSFHRLYAHRKLQRIIENPNYLKDWDTDEGMGRQVMTGISPLAFKRCREIPDYFNVKNDDVENFLEGLTLECQMEAGRVYISDYSKVFKNIGRNPAPGTNLPLICPEAVGLFFVDTEGNFKPIAIQLIPGNRDHLFNPGDSKEDWLLAKMYFRVAQSNMHEWIYHFLYTHSIMEPFAVSLFRCLPLSHPLYKLLRPHLRTVSAINADARTSLIPPTALPNKALATSALDLIRTVYKTFQFQDLVIPKVLAKNETDSRDLLPYYYYRDDALALWNIMTKYVKDVITYYYKSEEDITNDYELQAWVKDVATEGVGWIDGNTKGVPQEFKTFDELIELCVTIIYTSSVQHAAVNFGQYETYKFAPNAPLAMRLAPHMKGEATNELIMDSLPNLEMATIMVAVSFALSSYSSDDVFLGEYNKRLFTEEPIINIQNSYTEALKELEKKIDKRTDPQVHPYTFLIPSRVPNYIAI